MLCFTFTKKKFLSLSPTAREKWLIKWLSQIYQGLVTNRITPNSLDLFFLNYSDVLKWIKEKPGLKPEPFQQKLWIEFVSNAIHFHRIKAGLPVKDHNLLPRTKKMDMEPGKNRVPQFNYHIALDGMRSLFNVGSIFRICDAAGFKSVILGNTPGREHPTVKKTSMGSAEWIHQTKTEDLADTLEKMKSGGYRITGVETSEGAEKYSDYIWHKKGVVVMGNEEYGISSHVMRVCDDFVHIPMFGRKNSINVANAASVVVFNIALSLET